MKIQKRFAALALLLLLTVGCASAQPQAEGSPAPSKTPGPVMMAPTPTPTPTPTPEPEKKLVVIDPGHQKKRNGDKEPIGPGAKTTKAKVSSGTQGRFSGVPEYEVNLEVSLLLRDELEERGYEVLMTRESHDVNISNSERAALANDNQADAFVRIHCNGSEDPKVHGALTISPTEDNPYPAGEIYEECYSLSRCVLDGLVEATGAEDRGIWETDTMSGINWCEVPVTIVEMGYMTNKEEDFNLVDPDYQAKLVEGIANGIDAFLGRENDTSTSTASSGESD